MLDPAFTEQPDTGVATLYDCVRSFKEPLHAVPLGRIESCTTGVEVVENLCSMGHNRIPDKIRQRNDQKISDRTRFSNDDVVDIMAYDRPKKAPSISYCGDIRKPRDAGLIHPHGLGLEPLVSGCQHVRRDTPQLKGRRDLGDIASRSSFERREFVSVEKNSQVAPVCPGVLNIRQFSGLDKTLAVDNLLPSVEQRHEIPDRFGRIRPQGQDFLWHVYRHPGMFGE